MDYLSFIIIYLLGILFTIRNVYKKSFVKRKDKVFDKINTDPVIKKYIIIFMHFIDIGFCIFWPVYWAFVFGVRVFYFKNKDQINKDFSDKDL